jgi:hypothetical protein
MDKCKTILIAIVILALVGMCWLYVNYKEEDTSIYTHEIEVLKAQNDSLSAQNESLEATIEMLVIVSDSLQQLVEIKRVVIKDLKKTKYEKIKAIDDYSNDKLYRFFTELVPINRETNTDSTSTGW